MKKYYFVALITDMYDIGVCFSSKKVAEKFRENEIKWFDESQADLPKEMRYDGETSVRVVESNDNYAFKVYNTIEEASGEDCMSIMPYDNKNAEMRSENNGDGYNRVFPHYGEYKDLHVVYNADGYAKGYVVAMFTKGKYALDYINKHNENKYTFKCLRDIESGIDFRQYYFVAEKKSGRAICFSDADEAVKYAVHIYKAKNDVPFFKNGDFVTLKANNCYALSPQTIAMAIHNSAQEVIDKFDEKNFWYGSFDLIDDALKGQTTVCAVEFKTGEVLHQFTDKALAVKFNKLIGNPTVKTEEKKMDANYTSNEFLSGMSKALDKIDEKKDEEISQSVKILEKVMKYACNVSMDDFIHDYGKVIGTDTIDIKDAESKYYQMRGFFPVFFMNLKKEHQKNFTKMAVNR